MSEQKEVASLMTEQDALTVARMTDADAPHNQRAQALLAIHEGKTEEEAAQASGLRPTQVKYWVTRYGKSGLAIFPEDLLGEEVREVTGETAVSLEKPALEQTPPPPEKADKKKKKEKSAKDAKKSKKDKKSRKKKKGAKKDKKSKKKKDKKKKKKKTDKSKKGKKKKKKK
jgi:hypothetical protein